MLFTVNFYWYTLFSPTLLFFFFIYFKCDAQKLPSTPSESDRPRYPVPRKNSSQQFLTFVYPFYWAYIAFSVAFFCMHIYVENLLLITCLNVSGKGRIYYWNIFGLFSLFCLSG